MHIICVYNTQLNLYLRFRVNFFKELSMTIEFVTLLQMHFASKLLWVSSLIILIDMDVKMHLVLMHGIVLCYKGGRNTLLGLGYRKLAKGKKFLHILQPNIA